MSKTSFDVESKKRWKAEKKGNEGKIKDQL